MSIPSVVPPHNLEAEQAVLGSLLLDREAIIKTAEFLEGRDFYNSSHKIIYDTITDLFNKGEPVDLLVITDELHRRGRLEEVGGGSYLADLATAVPTAANVNHYAKIVRDDSIRRALIRIGTEVASLGYNLAEDVDLLRDKAEQLLLQQVGRRGLSGTYLVKDVLGEVFAYLEKICHHKGAVYGLPTYFLPIDSLTTGFQPSDLIIIAARPSVGKTAFALNIARNMAIEGSFPIGFFSLEMSRQQTVLRLLSKEAMINNHRLRQGHITEDEWRDLAEAFGELGRAPFYIDDSSTLTIMELRTRARRLKLEKDIKILFVDYLQLIQGSSRSESRVQEVSELTRALKSLSRELNIPLVVLSQLSRRPEDRPDRRPILPDLRESGSIEQDADMVIFLYRDDYHNPQSTEPGVVEVNIAKQRNGPTGVIKLRFEKEYSSFTVLETKRKEDEIPV